MKNAQTHLKSFTNTAHKYDLVKGLSILVLEDERNIVADIIHCLKQPQAWTPIFTYCTADQVESFHRQWKVDAAQAYFCYELAKSLGYRKAAAACLLKYRSFNHSPWFHLSAWFDAERDTERFAAN